MNRLEEGSFALIFDGKRLEPASIEKNIVGFCSKCDGELESLAYYKTGEGWLVSAQCNNFHQVLIQYDGHWNWKGDAQLEIVPESKSISTLPREQLEAIFTASEIRTMEACERGMPYTRQNLYRARAKYEKFEKLFGVKLSL